MYLNTAVTLSEVNNITKLVCKNLYVQVKSKSQLAKIWSDIRSFHIMMFLKYPHCIYLHINN